MQGQPVESFSAAMIKAAREGERAAQAALLRGMQDQWYRMVLRLLGDAENAREATQETALRFLKRLPGFEGRSEIRTWSLGIAINVAREMRRQKKREELTSNAPARLVGPVLLVRRDWWWKLMGTAVAGAAAAIVVAVLVREGILRPTPPQQRAVLPTAQPKRPMFVVLPGLPQAPKSMTLAPALGDKPVFLPSLPTFPSLLETLNEPDEASELIDQNPNATEAL